MIETRREIPKFGADPSIRTYCTSSHVNVGFTERINATTPAPIGQAAEVPEKGVQFLNYIRKKKIKQQTTLVEVHQTKVNQ